MKICVIGGTGHIGRFLVPYLVEDGHEVHVVSSGRREPPYSNIPVTFHKMSYQRDDADWRSFIANMKAEIVIDIIGVDLPTTYEAARGACQHLLACGSVWMFGPPRVVPTPEETQGPCESAGYARRYQELQAVKERARREGVPFTAIFPPNICGPGKIPLDCRGGRDIEAHKSLMRGEPVVLPENCNTLIGPCDASDIATAFRLALAQRDKAADQFFNVGSAYALTAKTFVETYADIFGTTANIEWVSWPKFLNEILPEPGANYHFRAHMCPDIGKLRARLGYEPRYTPEQTMARAVEWLKSEELL